MQVTEDAIRAAIESEKDDLIRRILGRLCPAPAARPDSAGEGGKDRAGEMAEKMVCVTRGDEGKCLALAISPHRGDNEFIYLWPEETQTGIDTSLEVATIREWFADALRAYGDELLEKIASEMYGQSVCGNAEFAALERWQAFVRGYKSSPTGAPHV